MEMPDVDTGYPCLVTGIALGVALVLIFAVRGIIWLAQTIIGWLDPAAVEPVTYMHDVTSRSCPRSTPMSQVGCRSWWNLTGPALPQVHYFPRSTPIEPPCHKTRGPNFTLLD